MSIAFKNRIAPGKGCFPKFSNSAWWEQTSSLVLLKKESIATDESTPTQMRVDHIRLSMFDFLCWV
jgi:hypothetical protein